MNYAAMGACPTPYGYGYGGYGRGGGYGFAPFPGAGLMSYDIQGAVPPSNAMVGAAPAYAAPARDAAIGATPRYDAIGQAEGGWFAQPGPLNISRMNWLLGAAAIGATWFAYSRGYLGGEPARSRDFDFGGFGRDFGADFFI